MTVKVNKSIFQLAMDEIRQIEDQEALTKLKASIAIEEQHMTNEELVHQFQCPGCVGGMDQTTCPQYKLEEQYGACCRNHVVGTSILGVGHIALGLPKGFCRPGMDPGERFISNKDFNQMAIRLWRAGTKPQWDRLNIPVWGLERDGFLFVRTYCPRLNVGYVDVVEGGTFQSFPPEIVAHVFNVGEFENEID